MPMLDYLSTAPNFLVYLGTATLLLVAFMAAYIMATPQHEIALIRHGNVSAAVVFSGTLLGFALPMASALAHAVNLYDLLIWGVIAGVVQGAASMALRLLIH